jgi:hypothetical protein
MVVEHILTKLKATDPTASSSSTKTDDKDVDKLYTNSLKNCQPTALEDYGYYFFPERLGREHKITILQRILQMTLPFDTVTRDMARKLQCEQYIVKSIESNPVIKTLVQALADRQCPIDLSRHFSCEYCNDAMPTGMFDPATNQISMIALSLALFKHLTIAEIKSMFTIYVILLAVKYEL